MTNHISSKNSYKAHDVNIISIYRGRKIIMVNPTETYTHTETQETFSSDNFIKIHAYLDTMYTADNANIYVRHFKREVADPKTMDYLYKVDGIVINKETHEPFVLYRALYKTENVEFLQQFIRPVDMFFSEVDHDKYPDIKQKYRFEFATEDENDLIHDTMLGVAIYKYNKSKDIQ